MQSKKDPIYLKLMNSNKWRRLRREILMKNPLCQKCLANNRISAAEEIHHITPVQTGITESDKERLAYDTKNLIALCHNCHKAEHKRLGKQTKEDREKRKQNILDAFRKSFIE